MFFRVQPLPFCSALPHRLHPQTHLFSIFSLVPSSISACQFPLPSARSFVFLPDLPALLLVPFACLTSPCELPAWSLDLSIASSLSDIVGYHWPPGSWPRLCFPDIPFAYSLLVLFAVDWLPGIELCSENKPILCLSRLGCRAFGFTPAVLPALKRGVSINQSMLVSCAASFAAVSAWNRITFSVGSKMAVNRIGLLL